MKKEKIRNAIARLEESTLEVKEASGVISDYFMDITQAVSEIREGMAGQAECAQKSMEVTSALSEDLQEICGAVEKAEGLVGEVDDELAKGAEIVQSLALLPEAVQEVLDVFKTLSDKTKAMAECIEEIYGSIEKADKECSDTILAVSDISMSVEGNAESAAVISDSINRLLANVENLNMIADDLGENVEGLKTELAEGEAE